MRRLTVHRWGQLFRGWDFYVLNGAVRFVLGVGPWSIYWSKRRA